MERRFKGYQFQRRALINCNPRAAVLSRLLLLYRASVKSDRLSVVCSWCDVYSHDVTGFYFVSSSIKYYVKRSQQPESIHRGRQNKPKQETAWNYVGEREVRSETGGMVNNTTLGPINWLFHSVWVKIGTETLPHRVEFSLWSRLVCTDWLPTAVDDLSFICQNVTRFAALIPHHSCVCSFRRPPILASLIVVIN